MDERGDLGTEVAVMGALAFLGVDLLRPGQLAWLGAALALALLGARALHRRRLEREALVAARHKQRFLPSFSKSIAAARVGFAALAALFLALAVAGPVRGYTEKSVARRGLDLVVCIDTSRSMLVRDLRPDRLTRAKREVAGLVERMHGDRIALVAFAGESRDVSPLTHDRTTLRALLERVDPSENTKGGTDLGAAMNHALALFDGRSGSHEAIVLLTDGEDLEDKGLDAAKLAAERGIRVYVVGMGTESGGKIPQVDANGRESFVVDEDGREVVSSLRDGSLREIARAAGGEYISAGQSAVPLEELYEQRINRLEGRELEGALESVPHDRYQWFGALALACMVIEGTLRERRKPRGGGRA